MRAISGLTTTTIDASVPRRASKTAGRMRDFPLTVGRQTNTSFPKGRITEDLERLSAPQILRIAPFLRTLKRFNNVRRTNGSPGNDVITFFVSRHSYVHSSASTTCGERTGPQVMTSSHSERLPRSSAHQLKRACAHLVPHCTSDDALLLSFLHTKQLHMDW